MYGFVQMERAFEWFEGIPPDYEYKERSSAGVMLIDT
jgi:hypothetical protein